MNASTVQDMWNTRPVRRRSGNTVAGVCIGVGERYRVDPTLVKVAFVVATVFGGSGILLYIAAAIALPAEDESKAHQWHGGPPWARAGHRSHLRWIPLVIIAVIAMSIIGSPNAWGTSGVLGAVLMAGGWYLLYQRTPVAPAGTSAAELVHGSSSTIGDFSPVGSSSSVDPGAEPRIAAATEQSGDTVQLTKDVPPTDAPPSWDPLGAARFAWDLPEPTEPVKPPAPRVPRSPVTPIFLGLAVMTGAATSAASLAGVGWLTPGRIASLVLAVLGTGLVVASLQRRPAGHSGSGLIPLAALGAVAVLATTAFAGPGETFPSGGVGERTWTPPTSSDLRDDYSLTIGSTTLDLRELNELDKDRTVSIRQGIGEIKVFLPDDIRVRTDCSVTVGDVSCKDGVVNPDAKTPTLTIDAHVNMGNVEMIR
ncbi:PspC domain-containing protein [Gordonia sp. PDNC005]|uniref:PspC domain-containing protein n=1 Tax=Gordonia sp. PDNC005 TaxID=2811424 RepID=UPI001964B1AC|nr:PspC domain-containing protein [Gordonia sp. PDNC005]QRY63425.1 PspC domain-containing protein [Gordonia sp. PDNC005]